MRHGTDLNFNLDKMYLNKISSVYILFWHTSINSIILNFNKSLYCKRILKYLIISLILKSKHLRPNTYHRRSWHRLETLPPPRSDQITWILYKISRNCNLQPLLRPSLSLTRHLYDKTIRIKVVWNYFLHLITCIFHKHNKD